MMMKKIYIGILLSLTVVLSAQGQSAAFLEITPDARSAAMGNAGIALPAGAYSIFHNTAGVAFSQQKGAVAYSYTPWMRNMVDGSNLHAVGGYYKIGKKQGVAVGMRYFSNGDIDFTDEHGASAGSFTPKEWALDVGYALAVSRKIAVSLSAHYISSDMGSYNGAKNGNAFAADLGAVFKEERWSVALALTNIGSKIDYGYSKYDLPGSLKAGGMYEWLLAEKHQLTGTAEVNYRLFPSDYSGVEGGVGAEYIYNRLIAARVGYHFGEEKTTGYNYATAGVGVQFHGATLDASYLIAGSDCPLKNTFRISVGWNF